MQLLALHYYVTESFQQATCETDPPLRHVQRQKINVKKTAVT